jgi:biopolymer transport protein ExbB
VRKTFIIIAAFLAGFVTVYAEAPQAIIARAAVAKSEKAQGEILTELMGNADESILPLLDAWRKDKLFLFEAPGKPTVVVLLEGAKDAQGAQAAIDIVSGKPIANRLAADDLNAAAHSANLRRIMKAVLDLTDLSSANPAKKLGAIAAIELINEVPLVNARPSLAKGLNGVIFSIERAMTIARAKGKGNIEGFVRNIKNLVASNQFDAAIAECDKQQGSLANVVRAGIEKIQSIKGETMDKESRVAAIQKEIEEATALELPMLSKNLVIISTCATIATLWGLIGTVLGMIRSFAALSNAGAPDTTALATGISEALINTALGITASVIGIIMYNYFSTKIDAITYSMDEAGFTIVQSVNISK